jgi:deoxycytidylate deaminase
MDLVEFKKAIRIHSYFIHSSLEAASKIVEENTECKRKGVACLLFQITNGSCILLGNSVNGPLGDYECTNEVGNCGCAHAEAMLICGLGIPVDIMRGYILAVNYAPCTNCANLIAMSRLFDGVVYLRPTHHDERGLTILNSCNVHTAML